MYSSRSSTGMPTILSLDRLGAQPLRTIPMRIVTYRGPVEPEISSEKDSERGGRGEVEAEEIAFVEAIVDFDSPAQVLL